MQAMKRDRATYREIGAAVGKDPKTVQRILTRIAATKQATVQSGSQHWGVQAATPQPIPAQTHEPPIGWRPQSR